MGFESRSRNYDLDVSETGSTQGIFSLGAGISPEAAADNAFAINTVRVGPEYPFDGAQYENRDLINFGECPEGERERYLQRIKKFDPKSGYEGNYHLLGGLYTHHQSTLHQVWVADSFTHQGTYVESGLEVLQKSTFLPVVADEVGHRPDARTFDPAATDGKIPEEISAMVEDAETVYLKQDKSAKGNRVFRVTKVDEGYHVKGAEQDQIVPALQAITLPPPERTKHASWIAEEEIPIARTMDGNTWEVRFLPPFAQGFAKVGDTNRHINNIAKGGALGKAFDTVHSAILANSPDIDPADARAKAQEFLQKGYDLSRHVKAVSDGIQVGLAKRIVTVDDLKDPAQYDAVMQDAFGGNFLCVDITGVWDSRAGTLEPVIIEAQPESGMPPSITRELYPKCKDAINRKRALLQSALK